MFRCGLMAMILFWVGLGIAVSFNISDRIQALNMEKTQASCSAGESLQSFRSAFSAVQLKKTKQANHHGRKETIDKLLQEKMNYWNSEVDHTKEKEVALYFRSECNLLCGRVAEASKDFEECPKLAQEIKDYFHARIFAVNGQYKQALSLLHPYTKELRAYCYLKLNQNALAIKECNRMLKEHENEKLAYFIRAQAHQGLGENEKAIADYSLALYTAPEECPSFSEYLASSEPDFSTEKRLMHNAEVYQSRAICNSYIGKFDDAKADWKKASEFGYYL